MHNGDVFASYEDGPWTQVVDVTGLVVHRHNAKYEKSSNRSWVREHDAWMDALALAPEELLGPLESKSQWLESRVFSLDREIARVKWEVERREEALRWREGVDVFGFPRRGRRGGRRWEGDGCGR